MVDASERLQVLLTQEATFYKTSDYLTRMQMGAQLASLKTDEPSNEEGGSSPPSPKKRSWESLETAAQPFSCKGSRGPADSTYGADASSTSQINKHWREKICEWAYQVVDHFDLHREVVSIAMIHLDRYLAAFPAHVDKNMFQLLAMTCLYLSIKLNEYKHLLIPGSKSSMDTILQLSRGFFTLEQMEKMEYDVLQRLQWHVHPPTPQIFVKHFLFFLSVEEHEVHDLTQFMVELSVMDYFFVPYKASEVAIAALLNALDKMYPYTSEHLSFPFESQFFDLRSPNVQACRERLGLIYAQAHEQSPSDGSELTCTKGSNEQISRTTSPVSVMAVPQPANMYHSSAQHMGDSMDTEYSDDEDL